MTTDERKEWEILCRHYNVDSLYEAIEGCQEELQFLLHCAARLEPRPDEDDHDHNDHRLLTTPFNTSLLRRSSPPDHAVSQF